MKVVLKLNFFLIIIFSLIFFVKTTYLVATETDSSDDYFPVLMSVDSEDDSLKNTTLGFPTGVDVDSQGNIYITDRDYDNISIYNFATNTWSTLGSGGTGLGQFSYPNDIKISSDRKIYTVDYSLNRVQIYDIGTTTWSTLGSGGTGLGQFINPYGVEFNSEGDIYVADTGNSRVQIYDIGTTTWSSLGTGGTGLGQFRNPQGITVDSDNNIYVIDYSNRNLQKYNPTTESWSVLASSATESGQLSAPRDIEVGENGDLYISQIGGSYPIKIYNQTQGTWSNYGNNYSRDIGGFVFINKISIDNQGNIYATDDFLNRVQKYNLTSQTWLSSGKQGVGSGEINFAQGMSISESGNIYVADSLNNRIQIYNSSNQTWTPYGGLAFGNSLDSFIQPRGIDVDSDGNVYVADTQNQRIKIYNSGTQTWSVIGGVYHDQGSSLGQFSNPNDIAVGSSGKIYVMDTDNNRVQIYNIGTTTWSALGNGGDSAGEFFLARGIAVDQQENIYVADTSNNRIQKYDVGTTTWTVMGGVEGSNLGQFDYPKGIDVDSNGNIYVADTDNHRIQKYDIGTSSWTAIGSEGEELGKFKNPTKVKVDSSGNLYVLDRENHRIQKLFLIQPYNVNYSAQINGSIVGDANQVVYTGQSSTSVVAVGNSGYSFLEWTDGSITNPRTDIGVTGDLNVSAEFTNTRIITNPNTNVLRTEIDRGLITSDGDNPANGQNYTFNINYTFQAGDATIVFPAQTTATKTGGGAFNLTSLVAIDNSVEIKNQINNSLAAIKINIPNINLSFSQPITITIPVSSSYEGRTLDVYFQSEGSNSWAKETTCLIINSNCTFQATHATTFTVLDPPQTSNNNYSSPDSGRPDYNCHSSKPSLISDLFQIDASSTKAKIYFTPQINTNDYVVSFSSKNKNAEEHGERVTLLREGVQSHTIYSLKPNTTYYVKVRGQNGCMPGDWSTIMKFKTGSSNSKRIVKYYKYLKLFKLSKWVVN